MSGISWLYNMTIPAPAPGSCYQRLCSRKMSLATLDHRQIAGVVKRAGEGLQPLKHLCPVDARDA